MPEKTREPNPYQYTVLMFPEDDAWVAYVPALDIATQGDDEEHVAAMARDAIELWITVALERGEEIPVEQGEPVVRQVAVAV